MPIGSHKAALLAAAGTADVDEQPEFETGAVLLLEDGEDLRLADGVGRLLLVPQEEGE